MKKLVILMIALASCTSCALKVYLVDRQTVLEDEAAGEWPEFEKEILQKSEASSPTPFPTVAVSSSKARLFNVLNGELASSQAAPAAGSSTKAKSAPQAARK